MGKYDECEKYEKRIRKFLDSVCKDFQSVNTQEQVNVVSASVVMRMYEYLYLQ